MAFGAVLFAGCSSDSSGSGANQAAASPTALVPGTAKVAFFDVPESVDCANATSIKFTVSWKVTGAKKTVVQVDAAPVPSTDRMSGSARAEVHCDPLPHDVVLIATDANGHFTTERKILETTGGAGS